MAAEAADGETRSLSHDTAIYTLHYTLYSRKNIPDIIDCHLKKGYTILIIFGTNISGTTKPTNMC